MSILGNFLAVTACFLSAALAQRTSPPPAAIVEGSVINKLTGAPVKNAHVIYTRINPSGSRYSTPISRDTDAEGHFSLQLTPASYRLWVERSGFARQNYGALSPVGEGTVLTLAPGQEVRQMVFRIVPLGAVAGRVFDEDGEPVQGVGIQVLRFSYANGRRQLISVAGASSNDHGEYRVFGLPAGRYLLRASLPGTPISRPIESGALVPETQDPYAAVYYPGVLEVDGALPISLVEGGELADVDFHLRKVRAITVRGRLVGPGERFTAGQIQVVLAHNEGNAASYIDRAFAAVDPATGNFEIRGVSPGSYLVVAAQLSGGRSYGGRVPVEVIAESPPERVTAALAPAVDIVGTVEVEGVPRAIASNLTVRLLSSDGLALGPQPASKVAGDGSIRLAGVTPGLWTLLVDSPPEGFWIKTESFVGKEVVAGEIEVAEGVNGPLRIVLDSKGAEISGTVAADGQPARATVVLVPAAADVRASHQLYRITNATERGAFTLKGVRPGSYKLFAFQEIEPFEWFDPEQLRKVEAMAAAITVVAGENALRDLVAIPPEALLPQH